MTLRNLQVKRLKLSGGRRFLKKQNSSKRKEAFWLEKAVLHPQRKKGKKKNLWLVYFCCLSVC
jgi:hypothetical protein